MSSMALLALGPHIFQIDRLNYQQIERSVEAIWASIPRFGGAPGRQFVGYGDDSIILSGLLWPEEFGDRSDFEAVRTTLKAANPVLMIGWSDMTSTAATIYGRVIILRISDVQTIIGRDGLGKKVSYTIELAPYSDGGKPVGLFS